MDLPELSRLGFRTAALMSNWSLGRPAIKSVKQLMLGTYEHLFRIIPGTNLVLTQEATLPWDKATIRCWDFLRVRCIGAIEIARNPLAWHHTHVSCIEVPGIATIGFIAGRFVLGFLNMSPLIHYQSTFTCAAHSCSNRLHRQRSDNLQGNRTPTSTCPFDCTHFLA